MPSKMLPVLMYNIGMSRRWQCNATLRAHGVDRVGVGRTPLAVVDLRHRREVEDDVGVEGIDRLAHRVEVVDVETVGRIVDETLDVRGPGLEAGPLGHGGQVPAHHSPGPGDQDAHARRPRRRVVGGLGHSIGDSGPAMAPSRVPLDSLRLPRIPVRARRLPHEPISVGATSWPG